VQADLRKTPPLLRPNELKVEIDVKSERNVQANRVPCDSDQSGLLQAKDLEIEMLKQRLKKMEVIMKIPG
jgi:hypothetical protein